MIVILDKDLWFLIVEKDSRNFTYGIIPEASENWEVNSLHWSWLTLQVVLQFSIPLAHWFEHPRCCEPDGESHDLQRSHVWSQSKLSK